MKPALCVIPALFLLSVVVAAQSILSGPTVKLPTLRDKARVIRENNGIAHILAQNERDLFLLQGYVHAQDRLFQMDVSRREASGTLAELVGPAALSQDVQLRTIGLRRAAVRSLQEISWRAQAALQAYADGVNAFVAANPLPPEYAALELSKFEPWTPTDSLVVFKLISFGFTFDLDIDPTVALLSYQQAGHLLGFDGMKLFFEDLDRSAPFDPASTILDASAVPGIVSSERSLARPASFAAAYLHPRTMELAKQYVKKIKDIPVFQRIRDLSRRGGSNEWAISGAHSSSGFPLLANDPHAPIGTPSTFYPVHLEAGAFNVIGNGFAGIPFVHFGHNKFISWGATLNPMDVTDTFQEQIAVDTTSPSGLSSVHEGKLEPIIPIPEIFRQNNTGDGIPNNISLVPPGGGIPSATLIVPRRNNGPIISLDLATGVGLSVQYTGFSGTREVDTVLVLDEARNLDDFLHGLAFFDTGSLNFAYSDVAGNIAYFAGGEMPIREDLQAGVVNGLPPFFIRNGTSGNEWLPVIHRQPKQVLPYEILPFSEMPHIVNPPAGWFVSANNDPIGLTLDNSPLNQLRPGGGLYYVNYTYSGGFRAGRITQLIKQKLSSGGKVSFEDMQTIQADVALLDAQVFVPYITQALTHAQASGANPVLAALGANAGISTAVGRLSHWDFTTPTGIPEGYDSSDEDGQLSVPSSAEVAASVAATIYSVWRGQFIANTIDAVLVPAGLPTPNSDESLRALRHLLDNFSTNSGMGASGLNFFNVPDVDSAADRRDILILQSLSNALTLLAGTPFVNAFAHSTNQDDYRWGKLHRVTFDHLLGSPFSIPPAGGAFPQPLPNLPGIPTDGGFETVDVGSHPVRAASENAFMFGSSVQFLSQQFPPLGPVARFVSEASPGAMHAVSALPGGTSGILGSPFYFNLLPNWLTNDAFPLLFKNGEIQQNASSVTRFVPAQ